MVVVAVVLGGALFLSRGTSADPSTAAPAQSPQASSLTGAGASPTPQPSQSLEPGESPSPNSSATPAPSPPATATPAPTPIPGLTGQIVFAAEKNGNNDVRVWNAADGSLHKLAGGSGDQSDPSWSWDRSAVVYRTVDGLRLIGADGVVPADPKFTHHGVDRHPAWSPDIDVIAFASTFTHGQGGGSGGLDIYTRPVSDHSGTARLTDDPADDWDPNWSPDGSTIAFASKRTGDAHLFLMNADGSNERLIDLGPGIYDDPSFSPDGQWLAFTRRDNADAPKALYVAHPDGTGMRRVTSVDVNEHDPTWSPDGTLIAVVRGNTGSQIVVVDLATGADVASLGVEGATNRQPDWR